MRLRLFKKYFFTIAAIILFSITGIMVILTFAFNNYMAKTSFTSLSKTCTIIGEYTSENFESSDVDEIRIDQDLYSTIKSLSRVSNYDIFLADTSGNIKCCSCAEWEEKHDCSHSLKRIETSVLSKAETSEPYFTINTLSFYDTPHRIVILAIKEDSSTFGYVVTTVPISATHIRIKKIVQLYLISAIFPLIIMFFTIYIMTYRLTKPMKQMSQAAKAMAKGDFSRRIPVTSDDEMGELAISFNQMTNSLAQLEGMRRSFVANVSHELKTPMTSIVGFIDGIIDGTIPPEDQAHYLGIVSCEVKRLSRLVQSMLELARLESGEFVLRNERFDFKNMLLDIVINQEQRIDSKRIKITGLDNLPNVEINADKDLLHQVVYNLTDNAIKFCNEDGSVSFSLKHDNHLLIFTITNTGKGIPKNELPLIFERFYKVDKSRSSNKNSTGLGLYIVKTIVKSHGGTITASSKENEFTSFELILPLSK